MWEQLVLGDWRSASAGSTATRGLWISPSMHRGSYNVTVECPGAHPVVKLASLTGKLNAVSITLPTAGLVRLKSDDSRAADAAPAADRQAGSIYSDAAEGKLVNLVKNPSFEQTDGTGQPASWSISTDVYSRSTVGCRSDSSACLHWRGTNPKVYRFATQAVKAVHPGILYTMSAAIRTKNLTSPKGGYASITGSWLHVNGKYYGGTWPMGLDGSTNWTTVSGSFKLPSDAKPDSFVLAVYVRATKPGDPVPTGEAWFDDLSVSVAPTPPKPCPVIPLPLSGNLVRNPNFVVVGGVNAGPCEWSGLIGPWGRSTAANTTIPGVSASLRFNGTDPKVYQMVLQHIPGVLPGVSYLMSASVKTVNLTSLRGGYASITASWVDVDPITGKTHYGGAWPTGPAGTTDGWVGVSGLVSLPATAQPGSFSLMIYARPFLQGDPTPTGLAFYDNVSIVHAPPVPLRTTLISPVYRGQLHSHGDSVVAVIVRAHFIFDTATVIPGVAIQLELKSRPSRGNFLWRHSLITVDNTSLPLDLNVSRMLAGDKQVLPPGEYSLSVACVNTSGTVAAVMALDRHNLTVLPPSTPPPRVGIDQHSRLVLNGTTPYFPMGFVGFCSTLQNESLMAALRPGFNTIMPYGEISMHQLDLAEAAGIKIAFSLKDIYTGLTLHGINQTQLSDGAEEEAYFRARVAEFRHHPAVLAWYIKDDDIKPTDPRVLAHQVPLQSPIILLAILDRMPAV